MTETLISLLTTILSFAVVVGIVIFIHELGHFLAARISGVRVDVFSIGLPPRMFGLKRGGTEYRIGWIPLGGYVKIAGMVDESFDEEGIKGEPDEFMSKKYPAKVFILSAGVLMNLLLGFLLYSFIIMVEGQADLDPTSTVGSAVEGYPAMEVGIRPGDRILSIDSQPTPTWEAITEIIHDHPGDTLLVRWLHESDTLSAPIVARREVRQFPDGEREIGLIGIGPNTIYKKVGFFRAIGDGAGLTLFYLKMSVSSIAQLITGRASIKEVTGIVGIVHLSGETVRAGWVTFVSFIAFISIAIGFFNILPVPMLDGGHLVVVTIEALLRKPLPTRLKIVIQQIGLALILLLMVVVTYHDVLRYYIK